MNVAVNGRPFTKEISPLIQEFFNIINDATNEIQIELSFRDYCQNHGLALPEHQIFSNFHDLSKGDLAISIGGDGTLLDTISHVGQKEIPVLGINTGRLGYLATTRKEDIKSALQNFSKGNYKLDSRVLLQLHTNGNHFANRNYALNEIAVLKRDTSSMIRANIFIDDIFLNSYWADGIIVSTPTGSTGYSLSCGGPIVLPGSRNFIITPICPHNLNMRPLIISDTSVLRIEVEGRTKSFLISMDSRSQSVPTHVTLEVKKAPFEAHLLKFENSDYYSTLREKLNWGLDNRN